MREAVEARHIACYVACRMLGMGVAFMGRQIERDHSTVLYACRQVQSNPRLLNAAEDIGRRLGWAGRAEETEPVPLDGVSA
jgi:chromosomal replication initiation ATPase DnaA